MFSGHWWHDDLYPKEDGKRPNTFTKMIKAGKCVILKTKLYSATKQRDKPALRELFVRHRECGLRGLVYLEDAGAAPAT